MKKKSNNILKINRKIKLNTNFINSSLILNNKVHLGNENINKHSSSIINSLNNNTSLIKIFKSLFFFKILLNHFLSISFENQTILINDSNLINRRLSLIHSKILKKYFIFSHGRWQTGSISNFIFVQVKAKILKIFQYKKDYKLEMLPEIIDKNIKYFFKNKSFFNFRYPNLVYNLYNHNYIIHKETISKNLPFISFLDSHEISAYINYLPIPGNNNSFYSLNFYKNLLISILKISIISNIFYILELKKQKKKKIINYKKFNNFFFFYNINNNNNKIFNKY